MAKNPDGFESREEAQAYLTERKKSELSIKKEADQKENIFTLGRQN